VKKVLSLGMAVALVTVLVVGAALAVQGGFGTQTQGMMPEVVVTAEMPRLVMPTVEVVGVRTAAMSGSDLRVN